MKVKSRMISGSLAAMACVAAIGAAKAGQADAILDAFIPCTIGFFDRMKAERATFGPVGVRPHDDPNAGSADPAALRVAGFIATLDSPVVARGLHIRDYMQAMLTNSGKPGSYWWGFGVSETPAEVAKLIKAANPDADFRQQGPEFGWVQELDPEWRRRDKTAIESRQPWRMLLISPRPNSGSDVRCGVFRERMDGMMELPSATELFASVRQ